MKEVKDVDWRKHIKVISTIFILCGFASFVYIKQLTTPGYLINAVEKINVTGINYTLFSYRLIIMIGLVNSIIMFISGLLLINYKENGRRLTMSLSGANIISALSWITYHFVRRSNFLVMIGFLFSIIMFTAFIYTFTRTEVKKQFK
jgi:hypothetical protein